MTLTFDLGGGGEQLRLRPCFLLLFRGLFLLIFFLGTSVLPNRNKGGKDGITDSNEWNCYTRHKKTNE